MEEVAEHVCTVCGLPLAVGEQGCIVTVRSHVPADKYHPFKPYFDFALGKEITSFADRWSAMKEERDPQTGDVVRGKLEYRDKMSKGELNARRDRLEQQHQARERAARG